MWAAALINVHAKGPMLSIPFHKTHTGYWVIKLPWYFAQINCDFGNIIINMREWKWTRIGKDERKDGNLSMDTRYYFFCKLFGGIVKEV